MTDSMTSPQGAVPSYVLSVPQALVIAEPGPAGDSALDALELAGFRARTRLGFDEAARDLSSHDGIDLIVVEAAGVAEAMLDLVLTRADTVATERALAVAATVLPGQIDMAMGLLTGARVQILCDPSIAERASALAFLRWRGQGVLHDAARDAESLRLQRLNEEVARIADTLARLTRGEEARAGVRDAGLGYRGPEDGKGIEPSAQEIRAVIRSRRLRAQFFSGELFADPAWDMLLDLFAAQLEHRQVSVSSLCIAAAVPPTTALRWIGTLHEAGLFERHADPSDRRRAYIALSEKALEGMRSYAGAAKRAGLSLV